MTVPVYFDSDDFKISSDAMAKILREPLREAVDKAFKPVEDAATELVEALGQATQTAKKLAL